MDRYEKTSGEKRLFYLFFLWLAGLPWTELICFSEDNRCVFGFLESWQLHRAPGKRLDSIPWRGRTYRRSPPFLFCSEIDIQNRSFTWSHRTKQERKTIPYHQQSQAQELNLCLAISYMSLITRIKGRKKGSLLASHYKMQRREMTGKRHHSSGLQLAACR